ncbi:MAG: hypothetical protein IJF78_17755, partial [Clostridia bacterium]|nr:hypothetical protein [Clostridia bacterium]
LYRCVRTAFTDDEGALWGMSRTFTLKTLLSTAEYVGDRESWTVDEMVGILSSLPDGRYIMEDLGRYGAMDMLLGECGYSLFFDADKGLNGFNSTEFRDLLAYCASLPMAPSLIRTTPVGNGEPSNVHIAEAKGEVALREMWIQRFCDLYRMPLLMGEDYRIIGYPSSDEVSGTAVNIYKYYMMTAFCDTPDEAWEFLKHQLTVSDTGLMPGIYSLKSADKANTMEKYGGQNVYITWSGTRASSKPQTVTEPHVALAFSVEHWQEFADFIDSFPGNPLLKQVPDDVMSIVSDEVNDCLRGRTDPDSCAGAIESRVDLWLSEHE